MSISYIKNNTSKLKRKTVLLCTDMNVPLTDDGKIEDDFRVRAVLPTIEFLTNLECRIIICAHLGRPNGKVVPKLSLEPVAKRLSELLKIKFVKTKDAIPNYPVKHLIFYNADITQDKARFAVRNVPYKDIIFLENTRFYKGEEENDPKFSKQLSELADVYVDDAFGTIHRKCSSITGVPKYIEGFAGLIVQKEIAALDYVSDKAKSPFVVMMAGIKISDKAKTLERLGKKADKILLGGGIANLFLLAKGFEIGQSVAEKESQKLAFQIEKNFKQKIILPTDAVVANKALDKDSIRVVDVHKVGKKDVIVDIGPKTILEFAKVLKTAKTIVWNGPLGHFEIKPFHTGTMSLAKVVGGVSKGKCFGVVGGGETVDAVRESKQEDYVDHLSTGGGAMLEYLAGNKLPGIKALEK